MGNRKVLGNIGLGNFCKAVMEHKTVTVDNRIYIYNGYDNRYLDFFDNKVMGTPEEFIALFIESIYKLQVLFKVGA